MKKDDKIQASDGISITQKLKYSEQARTCIKISTCSLSEQKYFKHRKILQLVPCAIYPADLLLWIYGSCHNTFFSSFSQKKGFSRTKLIKFTESVKVKTLSIQICTYIHAYAISFYRDLT